VITHNWRQKHNNHEILSYAVLVNTDKKGEIEKLSNSWRGNMRHKSALTTTSLVYYGAVLF